MWPRKRSAQWSVAQDESELRRAWREACIGAGCIQSISTVTGDTVRVPRIGALQAGPPVSFTAELVPGQVIDDLREVAHRLAPHLGARSLRLTPIGYTHVRVELLLDDPLDLTVTAPRATTANTPIFLAQDENGAGIHIDIEHLGHMALQGSTRAGKSCFLYSVLSQLADRQKAGYPLTITGIDPSGILLRPFPGSVLGLSSPVLIEAYLTDACREMDKRLQIMPATSDILPITRDNPLRFIIAEELPGLWRWLDAVDPKAAKRCRSLLCRLLAEGHKVGIRVILVAQRCEATTIGATERAQCNVRVSFRVDTRDSLAMLHPDAQASVAEDHSRAAAGICLISIPGRDLTRARSPYLAYSNYVQAAQ